MLQWAERQASAGPRQVAFIMLILRELIGYSSSDAVSLAIIHAKDTLKLTDEEAEKMAKMMMDKASTAWPEGFM